MIDAIHRFHGRGSLRFVYQHGKTVRCPHAALKYSPNQRRRTYRVAVVVSRKVHKSAVVRNRIRRRLYELVRAHDAAITQPYDLVFTAFSDQLATMPAPELEALLAKLLSSAGIIPAPSPAHTSQDHDIVDAKEHA